MNCNTATSQNKRFRKIDFLPNQNKYRTMNTKMKKTPHSTVSKIENGYNIEVAIPGYGKEEISMNIDGHFLVIEDHVSGEDNTQSSLKSPFLKRFKLGEIIDKDHISATLQNGILSIDLKIKEAALPRTIEIV